VTIGERVAHRRRGLGLSQSALASKAGLQKMRVYRIENDVGRGALADELVSIAAALGVEVGKLLEDEEDPTAEAAG
jgi:transcriptional regulator with XRE-family HTH domain